MVRQRKGGRKTKTGSVERGNEAVAGRTNLVHLDWPWFEGKIKQLVYEAKRKKIEYVIGIAKGGLIPAVRIAHELNVPMGIIYVQSYVGHQAKAIQDLGWIHDHAMKNKNVLVVDDIYDTGQTMKYVMQQMVSVGYEHIEMMVMQNANLGKWFVFPWEVSDETGMAGVSQKNLATGKLHKSKQD